MRLINADNLSYMMYLDDQHTYTGKEVKLVIDMMKTEIPVPEAQWIPTFTSSIPGYTYIQEATDIKLNKSAEIGYECSNCRDVFYDYKVTPFCPHCGAKMTNYTYYANKGK